MTRVNRRTVLKGLGTVVALPWLESLAVAAPAATPAKAAAIKRAAFVYVPNGIHLPDLFPLKEGNLDKLPDILASLDQYKTKLNVINGQIGRASCRERVYSSVVAGALKKKEESRQVAAAD